MNGQIKILQIATNKRTQFIELTSLIEKAISKSKVKTGFCILHVPHTTAAITINENADPSVKEDILNQLNKVIPFNAGYTHLEGNSAAHIKASLLGCNLTVLIEQARLVLGTWQGIFFCEFDGPRKRKLFLRICAG